MVGPRAKDHVVRQSLPGFRGKLDQSFVGESEILSKTHLVVYDLQVVVDNDVTILRQRNIQLHHVSSLCGTREERRERRAIKRSRN